MSPSDRKNQHTNVQVRTDDSHASSSLPEASAAMPNANGMVAAT